MARMECIYCIAIIAKTRHESGKIGNPMSALFIVGAQAARASQAAAGSKVGTQMYANPRPVSFTLTHYLFSG